MRNIETIAMLTSKRFVPKQNQKENGVGESSVDEFNDQKEMTDTKEDFDEDDQDKKDGMLYDDADDDPGITSLI